MTHKLIILLCLFQFESFGQHMTEIAGVAISKEGIPQSNVNIFLIDLENETTTDECGMFTILIPSDRNGYLMISAMDYINEHSDRFLPFYFNLKKINSTDLDKDIIFRLPYSNKQKLKTNCPENNESKIIRLKKRNKRKLINKAANNGEHAGPL